MPPSRGRPSAEPRGLLTVRGALLSRTARFSRQQATEMRHYVRHYSVWDVSINIRSESAPGHINHALIPPVTGDALHDLFGAVDSWELFN